MDISIPYTHLPSLTLPHTAIENLPKGFPKHLRGQVKEVAEDGLLLKKPTSYGLQVSLNPHRLADIEIIVRN
jgi:hypothetical protein